jgi:beta-glucanase (GH16 family)
MAGHTYNYQIQTVDNTGAVSAKSFNTSITYNITPGPTVTLSASPDLITAGSSSTLTWSSTNATSCQAASPASWTSQTANSGSQSVSPTNTTTYTISCNGSGGITKSLPVTVKVTPAPAVPSQPQPVGNVTGPWKLVFDSEFNGSSLDTYQWSTGVDGAPGITNGYDAAIEQECYDPAQVNVSGGTLNLTAITKTEYCPPYGGTEAYTSGSVTTYGHFSYTYGYAEARIWLPGTSSLVDWPAFWELGKLYDVSAGEIDILESLEGEACATFHNSIASPSFCSTGVYASGWHTFAADWEPGYINFYFDGTNVLSVNSGITSSPMYLVLDLALSSKITSPDTTPATMKVDYVRVWQYN